MEKQEKINALYETIVSLESVDSCRDLFEDLCTQKELEKMAERNTPRIGSALSAIDDS